MIAKTTIYKNNILPRIYNLLIRGFSMASKLFLIVVLAKLLEPSEVGKFGLFIATVSLTVLIIGADFYAYSQRELLKRKKDNWSFIIQHQILAALLLYVLLLPFTLLLFIFELLPKEFVYIFYFILILEHIAQEIYRLLIVMEKQLLASWVLFVRTSIWIWIAIPLMWTIPYLNSLNTILVAWSIGSILSIVLGGYIIYKEVPKWKLYSVDKSWLITGLKVGTFFFVSTISYQGILTIDRYIIEFYSTSIELGVYVFYISLILGIGGFLQAAIFSFLYPKLIKYYPLKNKLAFQKTMNELTYFTIGLSLVFIIFLYFIVPNLINWINKPIYAEYLELFYILLTMLFVFALAQIPHQGLYAMHKDKVIVYSHITGLLIFILNTYIWKDIGILTSVALSLVMTFLWIGSIKYYYYTKYSKLFYLEDEYE